MYGQRVDVGITVALRKLCMKMFVYATKTIHTLKFGANGIHPRDPASKHHSASTPYYHAPCLSLQNPHLLPLISQQRHPLSHPSTRHQILHDQQVKLPSKRQEMRKERVEMRLDREMDDLLKMGVVQVGKDPEEVFVNVFGGVGERLGEFSAWIEGKKEGSSVCVKWMRGLGGSSPDLVGNTDSSSRSFCNQDMTKSMYVGAARETNL